MLKPMVFALLFAAEEPAVRGRLCIEKECSDTRGRAFAVQPSDRARPFVWTSADASTVQLGVIAPKADTIDLAAGERTQIDATIAGSRDWPLDVQAEVRGRGHWQWTMDAPQKLRRLIVPRGAGYGIALRAEHHRVFSRIVEAKEEKLALGALTLVPLPQVRGVVVDPDGKPIAGAMVAYPDATVCTIADAEGAFACEIGERQTASALVVSAGGFGEREVQFSRRVEKDLDVGRIELPAGYQLAVNVIRPAAGPATVTLLRKQKNRGDATKLKTQELQEREQTVQFDAGTGDYLVLVSGSGALERLEVAVAVKDADASETITIVPYRVDGTVRIGDDPLAGGTIRLRSREGSWQGTFDVRDGAFGGTLWQSEKLLAHLVSRDFGMFETLQVPRLGDDPTRWDIRLESRFLTGRVFDAETKAAVAGASLSVNVRTARASMAGSAQIAEDGSYRFLATRPGTYTLRASGREHVPTEVELTLAEEDAGRRVDFPLERGKTLTLEIVSQWGQPLPGAWVSETIRTGDKSTTTSAPADRAGRFTLHGRPGEVRVLHVKAHPAASFRIVRATIPAGDSPPLRVVVPQAAGALRLRITGDEAEGPPRFLVRYDGEFLSGSDLGHLAEGYEQLESGDILLPRLPAGAYEVWALSDPFEERQIIASNGTLRPPVRVVVAGGETPVHVVAPPRRRPQ